MFPAELGMNREVMDALEAIATPDIAAIAMGGEEHAVEVIMSALRSNRSTCRAFCSTCRLRRKMTHTMPATA